MSKTYMPVERAILTFLSILTATFTILLMINLIGIGFVRLGLPPFLVVVIIVLSFVGSAFNIPVAKLRGEEEIIQETYVQFGFYRIPVPQVIERERTTVLAINLGGALVPIFVSIYLLYLHPELIIPTLIDVLIIAFLMYLVSTPVRGVGIVTPFMLPPIVTLIVSIFVWLMYSILIWPLAGLPIIAYVGGTIGTLLGCDIFHLKDISNLGAPIASIGGAGTFDGIFLSGLLAVLFL